MDGNLHCRPLLHPVGTLRGGSQSAAVHTCSFLHPAGTLIGPEYASIARERMGDGRATPAENDNEPQLALYSR